MAHPVKAGAAKPRVRASSATLHCGRTKDVLSCRRNVHTVRVIVLMGAAPAPDDLDLEATYLAAYHTAGEHPRQAHLAGLRAVHNERSAGAAPPAGEEARNE